MFYTIIQVGSLLYACMELFWNLVRSRLDRLYYRENGISAESFWQVYLHQGGRLCYFEKFRD